MHFAQICAHETSETVLLDDKFLAGRRLVLDNRDRHEATLMTMNDLAVYLREQGRLSEADPLFCEALDGHEETLGDDHEDTQWSFVALGNLRRAQGSLIRAEAHYSIQLRAGSARFLARITQTQLAFRTN